MIHLNDARVRTAVAVYIGCFSLGILSHARDFVTHDWLPYQWGIPILDAFWTSLILLDAGVVALFPAGFRRSGLLAAIAVMACDVAANAYALFGLGIHQFAGLLVLQSAFFGYVVGSVAFVWPARPGWSALSDPGISGARDVEPAK